MLEKKCLTSSLVALFVASTFITAGCVGQDNSDSAKTDDRKIPVEAEQLFSNAGNLQNNKEYQLAAETWSQLLEKFPNTSLTNKARYNLGICQVQTRDYVGAVDSLEKTIESASDDPDFDFLQQTYLWLGFSHYTLGKSATEAEEIKSHLEKSISTFEKMPKTFPEGKYNDQALFYLGEAYYAIGSQDKSIAAQIKLIDDYAESQKREEALYNVAVTLSEQGQFTDSLTRYDQYLQEYANGNWADQVRIDRPSVLIQVARVAENAGDDQAALDNFKQAESQFSKLAGDENFPARDDALFKQAFCTLRQGRFEDAAVLYANLASNHPASKHAAESAISAGRFFYRANQLENAKKWLETVEKQANQFSLEATHWLCRIGITQSDFEGSANRAINALKSAGDDPLKVSLLMDAGDALYEIEGRRSEANEYYGKVYTDHPDHELAPQALYNSAFTFLVNGDYDQAVKTAELFEGKYANSDLFSDVREIVGDSQIKLSQFDEAEKTIQKNIASFSDHPGLDKWHNQIGLLRFLKDDYEGVITYLTGKVDQFENPADKAEANFRIGASQFQIGSYNKAEEALSASIAADSKWSLADEAILLLGRTQYELQDYQKALTTLERVKSDFPESKLLDEVAYRVGEVFFDQKDYVKAREQYASIASENSDFLPYAIYGIAWADVKEEKFAEAAKGFTRLLDEFSDHTLANDALIGRGLSYRQAGEHKRAVDDLDAFLKTDPSDAQKESAMYEKGLAQVGMKDFDAAVDTFVAFKKAIPNSKLNDRVNYELGWAYKSLKKQNEAIEAFDEIATNYSGSSFAAEAHFHVAQDYYNNDKFKKAIEGFEFCRTNTQSDSLREKSIFSIARSYFQLKEYEEAKKWFDQQVEDFPNGELAADAYSMIGHSLHKSDNHVLAVKAYKVAIDEIPKSATATPGIELISRLHGAQSANRAKDYQSALEFAQPIVDENPDWEFAAEAWYEIGAAQNGLGDDKKAIAAWQNVVNEFNQTGARARFMIGEILFGQNKHDEAIKHFKLVTYGYGGDQANEQVKKWQAHSAYEAARCSFVRISETTDPTLRGKLIEDAKKMFTLVVDKYPNCTFVDDSKASLQKLKNLK